MNDGLNYIREAIAKDGRKAKVYVVRYEIDPQTGIRDKAFKVLVPAHVALQELAKPLHKRGYIWRMIRPQGISQETNKQVTFNSLSDPELRQSLIDEAKAQLLAEMKVQSAIADSDDSDSIKPKRKKKAAQSDLLIDIIDTTDEPNPLNDTLV